MTVQEAIERADALKPNAYTDDVKYAWLSELDGRIKEEIFDTRAGLEGTKTPQYSYENRTEHLLAPAPYSEMYVYWLFMKMDFMNGEFDRFNNDAMLYNTAYLAFSNHINRNHPPVKRTQMKNI